MQADTKMEAKQIALHWKDILPSVFQPFRVGYQTQEARATQYHQDGMMSSLMTIFLLMAYSLAASFGNIMSSENVRPVRVYALEVSLCLYLSVGIVVLLMFSCSNNLRRQLVKTTRVIRKKPAVAMTQTGPHGPRVTRDDVLYYLPLVGILVFLFSVWAVDIIRILSYGECMDEYRQRDSRELYNEGGAAVTFHIARALFSLLIVVFAFKYHRAEVVFYRSLKMRFMFAVVIAGVFWLGLDSLLHHASDEFDDTEPYTSYDGNTLNYTCTTDSRHDKNRTKDEECFCKDTHMFRTLKDAGEYLYPVNVEFSLLALEYILFLFFTAVPKKKAVLPAIDTTAPRVRTRRTGVVQPNNPPAADNDVQAMEEGQRPMPSPDQAVLELRNVSKTDDDVAPATGLPQNPSYGSFQFEDYAMMCVLGHGSENCEACLARHASIKASLIRQQDRRSLQPDTLASASNSRQGSVRFDNTSTRGSSVYDARSARGSTQLDPSMVSMLEHTCDSMNGRIESLLPFEVNAVSKQAPNPILMSYNAANNVPMPSLRLSTPEDGARKPPPVVETVDESAAAAVQAAEEQDMPSSAAAEARESTARKREQPVVADTDPKLPAKPRLDKIDELTSRTTHSPSPQIDEMTSRTTQSPSRTTHSPSPQVSTFEADTEVVVDSIHYTEGESVTSSSEKKQSLMVSVKDKVCDQWLLMTISVSIAIVYLVFSVATTAEMDKRSVSAAVIVYHVFKALYVLFTCIVLWVGFHCCRSFATLQRGYSSFEVAILVMALAIFTNDLLSMFGAVSVLKMSHREYMMQSSDDTFSDSDVTKKAAFNILGSILNIVEVYLQTLFMFRAVSLEIPDSSQSQYKLYPYFKQVLMYLIPVNAVFWIVDSFVIHNPETLLNVGLVYFDEDNYSIMTLLLGPFALYYRFNLCLYYVKIYLTVKPRDVK